MPVLLCKCQLVPVPNGATAIRMGQPCSEATVPAAAAVAVAGVIVQPAWRLPVDCVQHGQRELWWWWGVSVCLCAVLVATPCFSHCTGLLAGLALQDCRTLPPAYLVWQLHGF
jgi:hypothetical protein